MNPERQKLIDRAKELNTGNFTPMELRLRIGEVCTEYLIEAKVDVDRLLQHPDWLVRCSALKIVWWGIGATDGFEAATSLLLHDPDEEVRASAALALYESAGGTARQSQLVTTLESVLRNDDSEYVRELAQTYLAKLNRSPDVP